MTTTIPHSIFKTKMDPTTTTTMDPTTTTISLELLSWIITIVALCSTYIRHSERDRRLLKAENNALKRSLESTDSYIKAMEQELEATERDDEQKLIQRLRTEMSGLKEDVASLKQSLDESGEEARALEIEARVLEDALEDSNGCIDDMEHEIEALGGEIGRLKDELAERDEGARVLEAEATVLRDAIEDSVGYIRDMEHELHAAEQATEGILLMHQETIDGLREEVSDLTKLLVESRRDVDDAGPKEGDDDETPELEGEDSDKNDIPAAPEWVPVDEILDPETDSTPAPNDEIPIPDPEPYYLTNPPTAESSPVRERTWLWGDGEMPPEILERLLEIQREEAAGADVYWAGMEGTGFGPERESDQDGFIPRDLRW